MDELLRPGEFAGRVRLSPKALRLYAEHGLLVPARLDERTGYRSYAVDQVERGHLIAVLRRAGMPIDRIGEILDLTGPELAAAVGRWWRGVEQDVDARRQLIRYVDRYLTGRQELMYDVQLRDTPELTMLTAERRVTVDGLDEFINSASTAITRQLDESGIVDRAPLRVIYHGMVTEDSDGPVEVAVPFAGAVQPVGDLRVRLQRQGTEAYTTLTREQGEFPGILEAYDAVGRWIDQQRLHRAGSPAEVYFVDRQADSADTEPALDVAWPIER